MSVIKANRKEGRLVVLTEAIRLAAYTVQITANEKNFPKRHRWQLTQHIVNEAITIVACIRRANAMRPTEPDEARYRRKQQRKAYAHAESMLTLMEIAYVAFNVPDDRVEHWTGMVVNVETLLRAWRASDRERARKRAKPAQAPPGAEPANSK